MKIMQDNLINITQQLLNCGYRDITFLIELISRNNVELDIEDIKNNFGEININTLIYESIRIISERFINENRQQFYMILGLKEYEDLDEYRSNNELYEIYTNYLDSHLWFKNPGIQTLFENSKYSI